MKDILHKKELYSKYLNYLNKSYIEFLSKESIYNDIIDIEYILQNKKNIYLKFKDRTKKQPYDFLKIYTVDKKMEISTIAPILLNHNLILIEENTFELSIKDKKIYIQIFKVDVNKYKLKDSQKKIICHSIFNTFTNKNENDILLSLLLINGITLKHIDLIRTYYKYAIQLSLMVPRKTIASIFLKHNTALKKIINFFETKFNPDLKISMKTRLKKLINIKRGYIGYLKDVESVTEDKILKLFFNLVESSIRTNFYLESSGNWISIKIDCSKVESMPQPRPFREIFIYGLVNFEGCHLRKGLVARGGLRWSERYNDFRTEILDLMKTQVIKNAQIIPTGAKGGFIVKKQITFENVRETYKKFITALLEIQDNISDNKIVHPQRVLWYEGADSYLVVAADKGTALFSDVANEISERFNYWLSDAFASGGKNGYDHKKIGITAKGAWESLKRNLYEIGKDIDKDIITMTGIGDMSGDVFGNGLILSKNIKLLAAFDHRHIFIDPDPDPVLSYKERKRLFDKKKSSWEDYDRKILSKQGAIFSRKQKIIELNPIIQKLLNSSKNKLTPDEIIKLILKLKCDVLYNGGIGTYIKSSIESNSNVADHQNDNVRVNADEINCRIIVEGGNLGLTQKARIEFAEHGGKIYTDSIDNSAGVNLSDKEVNMKILFNSVDGITKAKRNLLLKKYKKDIVKMVLENNYSQTLSISIDEMRSKKNLKIFEGVLKYWTNKNIIDRRLVSLPSEAEFNNRSISKQGLYKPELAIFLSYAKMDLKQRLLESPLINSKYLQKYVLEYFPRGIKEKYKDYILNHKLKDQILVSVIANHIVNLHGSTIIYKLTTELGLSASRVTEALIAAYEIIEAPELIETILDSKLEIDINKRYELFNYIENKILETAAWLLKNIKNLRNKLQETIFQYKGILKKFNKNKNKILSLQEKNLFSMKVDEYKLLGLKKDFCIDLALLEFIPTCFDILRITLKFRKDFNIIGNIVYKVGNLVEIYKIINLLNKIEASDNFEASAIQNIILDLRRSRRKISERVLVENITPKKYFEKRHRSFETLTNTISLIKAEKPKKFSLYILVAHQLENIAST